MTAATRLDVHLWRAATPPDSPQAALADQATTRLRYRDTAPGADRPTLVTFCDPPNMIEHYDALIDAFGGAWRVIVIELPGFGFSHAKAGDALAFAGTVTAVEQLLLDLAPTDTTLWGPCICGFVAAELAARAADSGLDVRALVLVQTPDHAGMLAWAGRMDPKRRLRTPILGQLLMRVTAGKLSAFWYRYATARGFDHAALNATAQRLFKRGAAYSLASMLQRWARGPRDAALTLPTLIIWGEQDRSHADTPRESSLAHAPNARIVRFEHCGHFPDLEAPQDFARAVNAFTRERAPAG